MTFIRLRSAFHEPLDIGDAGLRHRIAFVVIDEAWGVPFLCAIPTFLQDLPGPGFLVLHGRQREGFEGLTYLYKVLGRRIGVSGIERVRPLEIRCSVGGRVLMIQSHGAEEAQPLRRLTAAPSSLRDRWMASSVLMARVLMRNQEVAEALRKRAAHADWHRPVEHDELAPDSFVEIPSFSSCTELELAANRAVAAGVPTVLRGGARDSPAVQTWSLEFFEERCGDLLVPMFTAQQPAGRMLMREVLASIQGGSTDKVQVNNACDVLTGDLDLVKDLPLAKFARALKSIRYHGANLFISGAGDGSGYHCANEVNFFFQVCGMKEWFFVHPRYTPQMDPRFTLPRCTYFGSGLKWGQHPRHVPIGRVVLEPGDVLVNPPWWWHWVRNRSTSIGVATRWRSWRHRFGTLNPTFSGLQWLFPHQWKVLWSDYVRGGILSDEKWVHERA